jgi:hypothetical protein
VERIGAQDRARSWAATGPTIHEAASVLMWVRAAVRSGPSASKNASTVAGERRAPAHTSRPVSWSTTIVR